jgi:hypothetical protein
VHVNFIVTDFYFIFILVAVVVNLYNCLRKTKPSSPPLKTFKYTLSTVLPINPPTYQPSYLPIDNLLANDANGEKSLVAMFLLLANFSPNIDLRNMISTYYTSDFFHGKKIDPNSPDFKEKLNPNRQIFL